MKKSHIAIIAAIVLAAASCTPAVQVERVDPNLTLYRDSLAAQRNAKSETPHGDFVPR